MKILVPVLKLWLPLTAAVTLVCGIIYITVQQSYRSNANDPQNQIAEDAAYALNNGSDPKLLVASTAMEISRSLKPFLVIYDDQGNVVASDGLLDGKNPSLPNGVLDYTRSHSGDAITWQPREGVRSALVLLSVQNAFHGFVVAGRSLRMVEERESMLIRQIALGWIISIGLLLIFILLLQTILK